MRRRERKDRWRKTSNHFYFNISKYLKTFLRTALLIQIKIIHPIKPGTRLIQLFCTQEVNKSTLKQDLSGVSNMLIELNISSVWTTNKFIAEFVLSSFNKTFQPLLLLIYMKLAMLIASS